jgi:2-polyprenyl-3-methyl-5-hydroxy-6-metoxy-1,4-benzoquinol methylase
MNEIENEIASGQRFEFGANWTRFLSVLNDERIRMAEASLKRMLSVDDLQGKSFLDIGSGSGLFSLAARRLGARVHSFDYDPQSVACTAELRSRYFSRDRDWIVEEGSALDTDYLQRLGKFDVVYSWGVLHHTGTMWQALENVSPLVAEGGQLFIAIYNDQGFISKYWRGVKKIYNSGRLAKVTMISLHAPYLLVARWLFRILTSRAPIDRGMDLWHDMLDWLGGYPFEVSMPEHIFDLFKTKGFALKRLKTCAGRMGCNEFVFSKN